MVQNTEKILIKTQILHQNGYVFSKKRWMTINGLTDSALCLDWMRLPHPKPDLNCSASF